MRVENVQRDVTQSGVMKTATATIKATPKIFDMFANDTYANKPLAIMRELVANGVDAHVAAGRPDRPVEVILPTVFDPTCRIRDYGTGMSEEFMIGDEDKGIQSKFMAYTDGSTKDIDDKAIGGFGIGSKSPFAYVDQYTIRSVCDGVLSVYTMYKNEIGLPAIGLQAQTTTDEPNGVEISFPVEDADMQTFADAAQEALQYFRPLPLVTNGVVNPPSYTYTGTNWALRDKAGELGIIMGGVRYPAQQASMSWDLRNDKRLAPLLGYGIDLIMPIGSCGVAMSREALSYIPKTSENIKKALEAVVDDVVATFANMFDNCSSEWEAMKMLAKETGLDSYNRSARAQLLMANARYKGHKLETSFRPVDPKLRAWFIESRSNRKYGAGVPKSAKWADLADVYGFTPGRIETIIIDDLPQSPKSKTIAKIREYVEGQPQALSTLIMRGEDEKSVKRILSVLKHPEDYVLTSSLPEPTVIAVGPKAVRPRVRMFKFNGKKDQYTHRTIMNLSPAVSKKHAVSEIAYADQPDKGIVVVMTNFDLPLKFHDMMATDLMSYDDLVYVNASDYEKIKDNFEKFEDVFQKKLDKALSAYPQLAERLAVSDNHVLYRLFSWWKTISGQVKLSPAQQRRPFGRVAQLYEDYVRCLTDDQRKLSPFVKGALPKGVNPQALVAAFDKQQADAKILFEHLRLNDDKHVALLEKHL